MITSIFTFPLEPLGKALREMSLTSGADNAAAILFFTLFGLIPVFLWIILKVKKIQLKADYLLFLLSGVFFYTLYYSINPGLFQTQLNGSEGMYLSGLFYSSIVTYAVIRIYFMAAHGSKQRIHQLLKVFLVILAVIFGGIAMIELTVVMPEALAETRATYESYEIFAGMAGMEVPVNLAVMEAVTVMDSIMEAAPYILDIVILIQAFSLIKELQKDWYSMDSVKAAGKFADTAGRTLVIIIVLGFLFNLLQIVGRNQILKADLKIHIPFISIIFLLAVLLIAKYITASQKLKEENELFV